MGRPPKPPPTIHEAVRLLRKYSGLSQQRFATLLGISISGLQNYETNEQVPEPRALSRFAALARDGGFTDLEYIFGMHLALQLSMPGWDAEIKLHKVDPATHNPAVPLIRWPKNPKEKTA